MKIEIGTDGMLIDAKLLADLLHLNPAAVHSLMRARRSRPFANAGSMSTKVNIV